MIEGVWVATSQVVRQITHHRLGASSSPYLSGEGMTDIDLLSMSVCVCVPVFGDILPLPDRALRGHDNRVVTRIVPLVFDEQLAEPIELERTLGYETAS